MTATATAAAATAATAATAARESALDLFFFLLGHFNRRQQQFLIRPNA